MEVNTVIDLCKSIKNTLSTILICKEELLTVSDDYKHEVEILRSRLDNYQEEGHAHGHLETNTMMKILEKAEGTFKKVELRLSSLRNLSSGSHCSAYIWLWYARLSMVLFPENTKNLLEKVNEDIANIPKVLKEEGEFSTQMQAAARRRPIVETVNDIDRLYVPIETAHSAVINAIEHPQGPHLILLHGGVGKGKSTLARSMMQRYGIDTGTGDRRSFGNGNRSDTTEFDRVVWVSCGNCSTNEISAKQLEILQNHSPNSLGDSSPEEKANLKPRIAKALQDFLSNKNVLVVLDDISDERFLYAMWEAITGGKGSRGGKGVKILVTSQWRNICAKAGLRNDSCSIFMEDPTEDEAMEILACLVGLKGKCIPPYLQHTAKEMVKVTEKNPLALACLASHFAYSEDFEDQQAWQDALKGLRKLLDSPEERLVLPIGVSEKHVDSRSLCGAMKICIDSLRTEDAQRILFFMYAFKEETTPELVLRILHGSLKRSNCTFRKSRDELAMRELLKIHQDPQQPASVSLRSLVKLYMDQTMVVGGKEIKSLIDELLHDIEQALQSPESSNAEIQQEGETHKDGHEKERVALTLCALYFDLHDAGINKIVIDAMTRANITFTDDGLNDLRRQAIYPILSLMDMSEDEHWKEADVWSARQVFLTFICKHELDDKNISHLLEGTASMKAQLATLKAAGEILRIEKGPLLTEHNLNFLQALVQLLDVNRGLPTSLLEKASETLHWVCWKAADDQSTSFITNSPGVLDLLVSLISIPIHWPDVVAENAASALWNLAYCPNSETIEAKVKILGKKGVLVNLVKCLSEDDKPGLQRGAAGALATLCSNVDTSAKLRIANQDGLLGSLVKLMSSHGTPATVQQEVTRALGNLATAEDDVLKLRIVKEEMALEGLARLLSMHEKPDTQRYAIAALANLASTVDISVKIANQEGLLQSLVKLMSSHQTPAPLQEEATRALAALAATPDEDLRLWIVNEEMVLEGLARLLSMHDKPRTQQHAIRALANLAWTTDISVKIANQEGLLQSLVKLMSSHQTPAPVQEEATRALAVLAATPNEDLRLRIVNEEMVLEGLARLLSMHDKPRTQQHAIRALANLAWTTDISLKIANQEGLLQSLVKLMSSHQTTAPVQEEGTRALAILAAAPDEDLRLQIVNEEMALEGLARLLSMHDKPRTQQHAIGALANLALTTDISLKIANQEGLLQSLVKLMSSHQTPATLQEVVTLALRNLGRAGDEDLNLRIVNEETALEGLTRLLSMHDKPVTQQNATAALANLAWTTDISLKIANQEGLLQSLVKLMSSHQTPAPLQKEATRALATLAAAPDQDLRLRIVNKGMALEGLTRLLSMHDKPDTQRNATTALANLASTTDISLKIANQEGLLQSLVKLISSHQAPVSVQEEAIRALRNLATVEDDVLKLRIVNEETALEGLARLLSMHDKPNMQQHATGALANLALTADIALKIRIANQEGLLQSLVKLMSSHQAPTPVQEQATQALQNLATVEDDSLKLRIVKEEGAIAGLVNCLALCERPNLREIAGRVFGNLAELEEAKAILAGAGGLLKCLSSLLASGVSPEIQYIGARTLTLINPTLGKEADLTSGQAYSGRAEAFILIRMFREALGDLDLAVDLLQGTNIYVLGRRCFVRAKLGDLDGALDDANERVKLSEGSQSKAFALQERGVVKQMLGDLEGSLADLDEGLELQTDDYEILKHRGYVKSLLRDEEGARADAEWALRIKPSRVDRRSHTGCLGAEPVEYLGYKLK